MAKPGQGPRKSATNSRATAGPGRAGRRGGSPRTEPSAGRARAPETLSGQVSKGLQEAVQVLVVDDELVVRRVVSEFLQAKGYSVVSVESGDSALDWLKNNHPRVILLDIFMPGVNGLEVLRTLRLEQPEARVLVISGFADEHLKRKVKALGAVDCLLKPFDFNTLHSLVSSHLAGQS